MQLEDDLPKRQAKCKDAGKPEIKLVVREKQDQATAGPWSAARPTPCWPTPPSCRTRSSQTNGKLEMLGEIYDSAPYGYVIPKAQTAFAQAIVEALKALKADGTYKSTLQKWNNERGRDHRLRREPVS